MLDLNFMELNPTLHSKNGNIKAFKKHLESISLIAKYAKFEDNDFILLEETLSTAKDLKKVYPFESLLELKEILSKENDTTLISFSDGEDHAIYKTFDGITLFDGKGVDCIVLDINPLLFSTILSLEKNNSLIDIFKESPAFYSFLKTKEDPTYLSFYKMSIGDQMFIHRTDGYVFGTITEVNAENEKCIVKINTRKSKCQRGPLSNYLAKLKVSEKDHLYDISAINSWTDITRVEYYCT